MVAFAPPASLDEARDRRARLVAEVAELRARRAPGLHRKEAELGRLNAWIRERAAAQHAQSDWELLWRALRYLKARTATGEDIGRDGARLAADIEARLPDWYRKEREDE